MVATRTLIPVLMAARRISSLLLRYRRVLNLALHAALIIVSNCAAFWLRFDGELPPQAADVLITWLPALVLLRSMTFLPFRLFEGLWRYTSLWDFRNLVLAVSSSSVAFYGLVHVVLRTTAYPRSVFFIDAILLTCLMTAVRLTRRIVRELGHRAGQTRVLIYGAGDAGEMIARDVQLPHLETGLHVVGFVDDDPSKVGRRIHGIRVLGTREHLRSIVDKHQPEEILIAMPTADPKTLRGIVRTLEPFKLPIRTLPTRREFVQGRVAVDQIRSLAVEDLLSRAPVGLDTAVVRRLIEGRRVMVTGAGGSIGSELCRQIATLNPATLVLYERYENSLHSIETELVGQGVRGVHSIVGDITDEVRLAEVFRTEAPEILFHAAAHKHVPLMEHSPCEAVKNNVRGTRLVVETAERFGVDRFIMISTDKAVRPVSVMGVTKRVAELIVQAQGLESATSFSTVRFGNVLASNGSVVPHFLRQIKAGGPVTVTHPEMRRYFMLINEAVQLVLQAAATGRSGGVYVLDMGDQVKILDLARNLIRLAGFVPEEDVPITFVGLRPGEKLSEELIGPHETVSASATEKVLELKSDIWPDAPILRTQVAQLEQLAALGLSSEVVKQLCVLVPEFRPEGIDRAAGQQREDRPAVAAPTVGSATTRVAFASLRFALPCPSCGSAKLHRSHIRTKPERVRKLLTGAAPYRCDHCGLRSWLRANSLIDAVIPKSSPTLAPDLRKVDAAVSLPMGQSRPQFSPRQLSIQ